ncbi:hypothetical protein HMPREF1616_00608 [Escherichia coli 908658]|nr:hypothetical protein HMPREF1616_00608 [Escherichia coli 908658]
MTLEQAIVFPAPAGINRRETVRTYRPQRVPRASGDKPKGTATGRRLLTCSPRQRG